MVKSWKVVRLLVVGIVVCGLLGGCELLTAKGRCEITNWEQNYYQYLEHYGLVKIYYKVINTGAIDIDYYKAWFEVQCTDGSTFQEWTNGVGVSPGTYVTDYTYIDTADKEAVEVKITKFEVKNY
jgi:uncharacterized membrane protein